MRVFNKVVVVHEIDGVPVSQEEIPCKNWGELDREYKKHFKIHKDDPNVDVQMWVREA